MSYPKHFAEQSFQYNNLMAFAIIGVDNGDPNAPGFVRPTGGPHCIKIHGRTYHRVATANRERNAVRCVYRGAVAVLLLGCTAGGVSCRMLAGRYFVYDELDELQEHGAERRLNNEFLEVIYNELRIVNHFARQQIGKASCR